MYVCSIYYYLTHTFDIGDYVLAQETEGGGGGGGKGSSIYRQFQGEWSIRVQVC